jgi:hypothetical protein
MVLALWLNGRWIKISPSVSNALRLPSPGVKVLLGIPFLLSHPLEYIRRGRPTPLRTQVLAWLHILKICTLTQCILNLLAWLHLLWAQVLEPWLSPSLKCLLGYYLLFDILQKYFSVKVSERIMSCTVFSKKDFVILNFQNIHKSCSRIKPRQHIVASIPQTGLHLWKYMAWLYLRKHYKLI